MQDDSEKMLNRRNVLRATGLAGLAGLAGCIGTTDDGGDGGSDGGSDGGDGGSDGGSDGGDGGSDGGDGDSDGGDGGSSGPYEIGMVNSLTGSLSAFGQRNQRGKELALEAVNSVGIDDRPSNNSM